MIVCILEQWCAFSESPSFLNGVHSVLFGCTSNFVENRKENSNLTLSYSLTFSHLPKSLEKFAYLLTCQFCKITEIVGRRKKNSRCWKSVEGAGFFEARRGHL